jgi:hypothetical protein
LSSSIPSLCSTFWVLSPSSLSIFLCIFVPFSPVSCILFPFSSFSSSQLILPSCLLVLHLSLSASYLFLSFSPPYFFELIKHFCLLSLCMFRFLWITMFTVSC